MTIYKIAEQAAIVCDGIDRAYPEVDGFTRDLLVSIKAGIIAKAMLDYQECQQVEPVISLSDFVGNA